MQSIPYITDVKSKATLEFRSLIYLSIASIVISQWIHTLYYYIFQPLKLN